MFYCYKLGAFKKQGMKSAQELDTISPHWLSWSFLPLQQIISKFLELTSYTSGEKELIKRLIANSIVYTQCDVVYLDLSWRTKFKVSESLPIYENIKRIQKINKIKRWFFAKINKIDKTLDKQEPKSEDSNYKNQEWKRGC